MISRSSSRRSHDRGLTVWERAPHEVTVRFSMVQRRMTQHLLIPWDLLFFQVLVLSLFSFLCVSSFHFLSSSYSPFFSCYQVVRFTLSRRPVPLFLYLTDPRLFTSLRTVPNPRGDRSHSLIDSTWVLRFDDTDLRSRTRLDRWIAASPLPIYLRAA